MEAKIENNKLIPEFLKWELYGSGNILYYEVYDKIAGIDAPKENELKFHISWDWLMLVVEKIESLKESWEVDIFGNSCEIGIPKKFNIDEIMFEAETKIKATYKAVVTFIKWYNENK